MFSIEASKLAEIVARIAVIYVSCFALLRLAGRREMSELGPMDLLTMLLISEAVSPALTGGDESVTAALVAVVMLVALAALAAFLAMRSKRLDNLLEGRAQVLIHDGKVNAGVLRKQRITDEDLRAKLHEHGVLNVKDVARAYVEADGGITIVKRTELEESRQRFHHTTRDTVAT